MLVLRLVRVGRRNQPKFRLVAADRQEKLNGKVVEVLGHYDPAAKEKPFVFDKEKVQGWITKGGMPSNTVAKLLNMNGFNLPVHQNAVAKPKKKAQAKLDEANKPVEAPAVVAEAPVETGGEEAVAEDVSTEEAAVEAPVVEETTTEEAPIEEVAPAEETTVEPVLSDDDSGKESAETNEEA